METLLLAAWPFLNIVIWLASIWLFLTFINRFSERFGCGAAAIVFLLGVSMCNAPRSRNKTSQPDSFTRQFPQPRPRLSRIDVPKQSLFASPTYSLDAFVSVDPTPTDSVRMRVSSTASGFVLGLGWEPLAGSIYLYPDRQMEYVVDGVLTWRLLHVPVYRQHRHFVGRTKL